MWSQSSQSQETALAMIYSCRDHMPTKRRHSRCVGRHVNHRRSVDTIRSSMGDSHGSDFCRSDTLVRYVQWRTWTTRVDPWIAFVPPCLGQGDLGTPGIGAQDGRVAAGLRVGHVMLLWKNVHMACMQVGLKSWVHEQVGFFCGVGNGRQGVCYGVVFYLAGVVFFLFFILGGGVLGFGVVVSL